MATNIARIVNADLVNAANWTLGAPVDGQDLVFESIALTVDTNTDQSGSAGVSPASIRFARSFGASLLTPVQFGTSAAPVKFADVTDSVICDCPSGLVQAHFQVDSVPLFAFTDWAALNDGFVIPGGAITKLLVRRALGLRLGGSLAIDNLQAAFFGTRNADVSIVVDSGVSVGTWKQDAGESVISNAITTSIQVLGGRLQLRGSSKNQPTILVARGGRIEDYCDGGTRTLVEVRDEGVYDAEVNHFARTFTNVELYPGAEFRSANGSNVHTNNVANYGASLVSVEGGAVTSYVRLPALPR